MPADHTDHVQHTRREGHGSHSGHAEHHSAHRRPATPIAGAGHPIEHLDDSFPQSVAGLLEARPTDFIELKDGSEFELEAAPVKGRIGEHAVRMLAYNGSIPGPTLKVRQGDRIQVRFTNRIDGATTVHWHGLRVDNRFDGMPGHGGPPPIAEGDSFVYELRFPDAGIYWYHPHIREDYAQEHGLYGSILVQPRDSEFWPPADREIVLAVDDILMEHGRIASVSRSGAQRTAMGRFGNVMLLNGKIEPEISMRTGEVVRLYLLNTANARPFNIAIPGARMKLVGADSGPFERETFVDSIVISPSERYVIDVLLEQGGNVAIEHRTPDRVFRLGTLAADGDSRPTSAGQAFDDLRRNDWLTDELAAYRRLFDRPPDKVLALAGKMLGMEHHAPHHVEPIEWEDSMPAMNLASTPHNMLWRIVDEQTGLANEQIDWSFAVGQQVMLRLRNDRPSDHPMQHPFHVHGQRFLVARRNGVRSENLAWKDTVLVRAGDVVDILVDMSNPGIWMAHCHIAEHMESNMMLMFSVEEVTGDRHAHP